MIKRELVRKVAEKVNLEPDKVLEVVNEMLTEQIKAISKGEDVIFRGFYTIKPHVSKKKNGYNFQKKKHEPLAYQDRKSAKIFLADNIIRSLNE